MIFYKLYLLLGLLEVTLEYLEIQRGVLLIKPLLMPMLFFAVKCDNGFGLTTQRLVLFALFFSWIGDVLLMFESTHQIFFILGLLGFLGAHLLYIASLRADIDRYHLKSFKGVFGVVLMLGLLVLLTTYFEAKGNANYQGLLRLAVPIYSIVLGSLVVCSANQKTSSNTGGVLLFSGALLFMLSDMLIALGAFSSSINFMGVGFRSALIMFTYILAQFLIVRGLLAKEENRSMLI